jgi:ankyrin repeat protein
MHILQNPIAKNFGHTALMEASQEGHVSVVDALLKSGSVKKIAGVSVVIAIQEDTYMCVFDEDSLTLLSDGSHSIEYTNIFVPKGRAMFFNSFTCLHGGFDYSKFQLTKKLRDLQNNHARMFARFTHKGFKNTLPKNDFFLLEKVSVYIEKECAGT